MPRIVLAVTVMVLVLGSWALWRLSVWAEDRARSADIEWRRAFEPTGDEQTIVVHPEDVLHERPLSPQEYPR